MDRERPQTVTVARRAVSPLVVLRLRQRETGVRGFRFSDKVAGSKWSGPKSQESRRKRRRVEKKGGSLRLIAPGRGSRSAREEDAAGGGCIGPDQRRTPP